MPQQHRYIPVKTSDGEVTLWDGVAMDNYVAWMCTCKRNFPLIGCDHRYHLDREKMVVECPCCKKLYELIPALGEPNLRVREIREVEERMRGILAPND